MGCSFWGFWGVGGSRTQMLKPQCDVWMGRWTTAENLLPHSYRLFIVNALVLSTGGGFLKEMEMIGNVKHGRKKRGRASSL